MVAKPMSCLSYNNFTDSSSYRHSNSYEVTHITQCSSMRYFWHTVRRYIQERCKYAMYTETTNTRWNKHSSQPFATHNSSTGGTGRTKWHPWNYMTLFSDVCNDTLLVFGPFQKKGYKLEHPTLTMSQQCTWIFCSPWKHLSTRGINTHLSFNSRSL